MIFCDYQKHFGDMMQFLDKFMQKLGITSAQNTPGQPYDK